MPAPVSAKSATPESVAADTVRRAARVLSIEKVHRVELVCGTRVASALLSGYRRRIDELERRSGGQIDIRISEQLGGDRFDIYAYDDRNADIDLTRLPILKTPTLEDLVEALPDLDEPIDSESKEDGDGGRRRRRRRKPVPADVVSIAMAGGFDIDDEDEDEDDDASLNEDKSTSSSDAGEPGPEEDGEGGGKRRRRRRRGRRGRGPRSDADAPEHNPSEASEATPASEPEPALPVRVHVMAKDLGITSKEILTAVAEKFSDVELKNHMSSIPGEFVAAVRRFFVPEAERLPRSKRSPTHRIPPRGRARRNRNSTRTASRSGNAADDDAVADVADGRATAR